MGDASKTGRSKGDGGRAHRHHVVPAVPVIQIDQESAAFWNSTSAEHADCQALGRTHPVGGAEFLEQTHALASQNVCCLAPIDVIDVITGADRCVRKDT